MATNTNQQKLAPALIPRLSDYDVSDKVGFNQEDPLVELPPHFQVWNDLANNELERLVAEKKLRDKIYEMPLLDHRLLENDRQRWCAYTKLSLIGNCFVHQNGDDDMPKVIPQQLAIPWYYISEKLGIKPILTLAACSLNNWKKIDLTGPVSLDNIQTICSFPRSESSSTFFLVAVQCELDLLPGVQAAVQAMDGVLAKDEDKVIRCLTTMTDGIKNLIATVKTLRNRLKPDDFYNGFRKYLSGWEKPMSEGAEPGLIYEGVSDEPIALAGGSQAQSSSVQCYDAALGIVHETGPQAYLTKVRAYMPRKHADFIAALREASDGEASIKAFVNASRNDQLKEAYKKCVTCLQLFRASHMGVVQKYIVDQNAENNQKGTNGVASSCCFNSFLKWIVSQEITGNGELEGTGGVKNILKFLRSTIASTTTRRHLPSQVIALVIAIVIALVIALVSYCLSY